MTFPLRSKPVVTKVAVLLLVFMRGGVEGMGVVQAGNLAARCGIAFGKLSNTAREYWRYGTQSPYKLGFVIRDLTPTELEIQKKWLGFWIKKQDTKTTFKSNDRYHFNFVEGLNNAINFPIRKATKTFGKEEKTFQPPITFLLSIPALDFILNGPLDAFESYLENFRKEHNKKLLAEDFRFQKILKNLRKRFHEIQHLEKAGISSEQIRLTKSAFLQKALNATESLQSDFREFEKIEQEYSLRMKESRPDEQTRLTRERIERLLENPLFSDIPEIAKQTASGINQMEPAYFSRLSAMVSLREQLFVRYSLIPSIIGGGDDLNKLKQDPKFLDFIHAIESTPIFPVLSRLYREKTIDRDLFQLLLMEDSYWVCERFGFWKIMDRPPPPKLDAHGIATQLPLSLTDVESEMLSDLNELTSNRRLIDSMGN